MINQLMQAMVDRAPKKARAIQNQGPGKLEAYARTLARSAQAEIDLQNVPENDPNLRQMLTEIAEHNAMQEALNSPEDGLTTT